MTMSTAVVVNADADGPAEHGSDRRYYGYVLLTIALLATLCVPGLVGRRLQGEPAAAPPAPPPAVGQCQAEIQRSEDLDRLTGTALVPCSQPHSSEVVFVGQFQQADEYPQISTSPALLGPKKICISRVNRYAGIGSAAITVGADPTNLPHISPQVASVVVVPIRHQWDSGQHWFACQVRPAGRELPISYLGSVRAAGTGRVPAAFALCAQVIGGAPIPCDEPHYAEQLSAAVRIPNGGSLDCEGAARRIIGNRDPSFGSALSQTGWQQSGGLVACWATSTTGVPFVGTLIGLGDQPLPHE